MRILNIRLKNYIGLYNGLGLNEIYIDFTKCKYKTIVIKGDNGSGKSTLFKAMHPLYDSNDVFIPKLQAEKELTIADNDTIYNILFIHGVKANEERETTKAYIKKWVNNECEELNPNGNTTSFKEALFNEFCLDANFVALSQLSSDDRGLADKTPAERKKFVSSIINTLEVYNNIHKTLTKRSSIFKSMMNSLISKIDSIGDEEKVKLTLTSVENRLNKLLNDKDLLIEELASHKSTIQLIDPTHSIQDMYNNIYTNITNLNRKYDEILTGIRNKYEYLKLPEIYKHLEVLKSYNDIKNSYNTIDAEVKVIESRATMLLTERETEARNIQTKTQKLNALQSEHNYRDIEQSIQVSKQIISQYNEIINNMCVNDIFNISKEEYILGLNTLKDIKDMIDTFKSNLDLQTIQAAIYHVQNDIYPDINQINSNISALESLIRDKEIEYQAFVMLKNTTAKLQMRPAKCKIDDCQFIKDAVDAFKQNPDEKLITIDKDLSILRQTVEQKIIERKQTIDIVECINQLKTVIRSIEKHSAILNKLQIKNIFTDKIKVLELISNGHHFNEISVIYQYIDYANIIDEYKLHTNRLMQLENDYKIYQSKNDILDDILLDIDNINTKLNSITTELEQSKTKLFKNKEKLEYISKTILPNYEILLSYLEEKNEIEREKNELNSQFNAIRTNMIKIKESLDMIQVINGRIDSVNKEITPLFDDRDKLKHGVSLLQQYKAELEVYSRKAEKVETIKKYSSPSKGIQTIFMELYMNKTISMANDLLSLMFEGQYVLLPFEINESEFRIPCIGSGLPNDDISSMSTSQVCMISMILSFALLQQSSTKYNILKLDEIDGGLDTRNRLQFLDVLDKQMSMLNVEQCIMISHNTELDLSNCDLIILKMSNNDIINAGNVIYRY